MKCCAADLGGSNEDALSAESNRNKDIEKQLSKDKKKSDNLIKLLLLGAGESGKSTIAKQMKIIHLNGFGEDERRAFTIAIHTNIYHSIKSILEASQELGISIGADAEGMFDDDTLPGIMSSQMSTKVAELWKDPGVQKVYARRSEFQLTDSTKYYMENLKRITAEDYVPDDQDILHSRVQTTGIIETKFKLDGTEFLLVDVGGQRSERKKWIHCFEDSTAILFVVGISEFDQVLYEDNKTNRMAEALKLFHEICQSKWFSKTALILFLNKSDIFAEKLKGGKSIKIAYPEYTGPNSFKSSVRYIQNKFEDITDPFTGNKKAIFTHVTCATNTDNVRVVFDAVRFFIRDNTLNKVGLGV
jgi:GTPase SAR1 family protein